MDNAEPDVLAYMAFAPQHRTKLHSTNPLERLNTEMRLFLKHGAETISENWSFQYHPKLWL